MSILNWIKRKKEPEQYTLVNSDTLWSVSIYHKRFYKLEYSNDNGKTWNMVYDPYFLEGVKKFDHPLLGSFEGMKSKANYFKDNPDMFIRYVEKSRETYFGKIKKYDEMQDEIRNRKYQI